MGREATQPKGLGTASIPDLRSGTLSSTPPIFVFPLVSLSIGSGKLPYFPSEARVGVKKRVGGSHWIVDVEKQRQQIMMTLISLRRVAMVFLYLFFLLFLFFDYVMFLEGLYEGRGSRSSRMTGRDRHSFMIVGRFGEKGGFPYLATCHGFSIFLFVA